MITSLMITLKSKDIIELPKEHFNDVISVKSKSSRCSFVKYDAQNETFILEVFDLSVKYKTDESLISVESVGGCFFLIHQPISGVKRRTSAPNGPGLNASSILENVTFDLSNPHLD